MKNSIWLVCALLLLAGCTQKRVPEEEPEELKQIINFPMADASRSGFADQ